jgi:hypothetical protein
MTLAIEAHCLTKRYGSTQAFGNSGCRVASRGDTPGSAARCDRVS